MCDEPISVEDYHKLSTAIRDPDFPSLFKDYVDELTDPLNKAETIAYLNSLELNGELPTGKVLVRPRPWICFETSYCCAKKGRVFLNVVSSPLVEAVTINNATGEVTLPFIAAPPRIERHGASTCTCVDVIVSHETKHAERRGWLLQFGMIELIIDFLNSKPFSKDRLTKDVRVCKEWRYKDGLTASGIVPIMVDANQLKAGLLPTPSPQHTPECIMPSEIRDLKRLSDEGQECATEAPDTPIAVGVSYSIVEIGHMDYSAFMDTGSSKSAQKVHWTVPAGLRIRLFIPGMISVSDIDINTDDDTRVVVQYRDSALVDIPLPYKVDGDSGEAKFDRNTSKLTIEFRVTGPK